MPIVLVSTRHMTPGHGLLIRPSPAATLHFQPHKNTHTHKIMHFSAHNGPLVFSSKCTGREIREPKSWCRRAARMFPFPARPHRPHQCGPLTRRSLPSANGRQLTVPGSDANINVIESQFMSLWEHEGLVLFCFLERVKVSIQSQHKHSGQRFLFV